MEVMTKVMEVDVVHPRNGRTYAADVTTRAVEAFQRRILNNYEAIPGEAHPVPEEIAQFLNMANCSHVVKACHMEHGRVIVKLKLIEKFNELARMGVRFTGVMRCMDYDDNDKQMINRGGKVHRCEIITVDLKYRDEDDE